MSELLASVVLVSYYLTLGILAVYGAHRLVLLVELWRRRRTPSAPDDPASWPLVTVQLPIYNELYVGPRLVEAVARLDYPRDRLEIQVLDDSTDETSSVLARLVDRLRGRGVTIHHLRRSDRQGFKAGALEAGLRCASGELVAIFDADFMPPRDFLRRTVPHFADRRVGMVQACWEHINRGFSLLTRVQAVLLDGHFLIEHAARHRSGHFFNFNGTAGVWRREAIEDAGGWQHDTLTEDLDLSYRAQLCGWRFVFLPQVKAPAELPVDVAAFKSQQRRWAKGSIQTARKLVRRVLAAPLPLGVKAEALVHLTNNLSYLLMVGLSLLIFPAMVLRRGTEAWKLLAVDLPLFGAATLCVLAFYVAGQAAAGRGGMRSWLELPGVLALGIGLSVNNGFAVLSGLRHMGGTFDRTPKYRIERRDQGWRHKQYRSGPGLSRLVEAVLAVYFAICVGVAVSLEMWLSLPFLLLFLHGYTTIAALSFLAPLGRRGSVASPLVNEALQRS